MNYYSILGINREKFSKEYLDNTYKIYLSKIEEGLNKYSDDSEKRIKLEKIREEINNNKECRRGRWKIS